MVVTVKQSTFFLMTSTFRGVFLFNKRKLFIEDVFWFNYIPLLILMQLVTRFLENL